MYTGITRGILETAGLPVPPGVVMVDGDVEAKYEGSFPAVVKSVRGFHRRKGVLPAVQLGADTPNMQGKNEITEILSRTRWECPSTALRASL